MKRTEIEFKSPYMAELVRKGWEKAEKEAAAEQTGDETTIEDRPLYVSEAERIVKAERAAIQRENEQLDR